MPLKPGNHWEMNCTYSPQGLLYGLENETPFRMLASPLPKTSIMYLVWYYHLLLLKGHYKNMTRGLALYLSPLSTTSTWPETCSLQFPPDLPNVPEIPSTVPTVCVKQPLSVAAPIDQTTCSSTWQGVIASNQKKWQLYESFVTCWCIYIDISLRV